MSPPFELAEEPQEQRPITIDERTRVPVNFLIIFICGAFALFTVVVAAVYWGGLLQARAEGNSDRITKVEVTQQQTFQDISDIKKDVAEIKVWLQIREQRSR